MKTVKYLLVVYITCIPKYAISSQIDTNNLNDQSQPDMIEQITRTGKVKEIGRAEANDSEYLMWLLNQEMEERTQLREPNSNMEDEGNHENKSYCKLELCPKCISLFRHDVAYSEANFVYLKLVPTSNVTIKADKHVVGEDIWVWTFYGKEGGLKFMNWPIEFGIWSMGLLTSYTITKPLPMIIEETSGNCSDLKVGRLRDDKIISNALLNLTLEMMDFSKEKYGPSFFCYKRRRIIKPDFLYSFCKHIVCPLEALEYNCCSYYYQTYKQKREITCRFPNHVLRYETVSWVIPIIIAMVLFAYCPLVLLYLAHILFGKNEDCHTTLSATNLLEGQGHENNLPSDKIILLNEHHPITLLKTLFSPIRKCQESLVSKENGPCHFVFKRFKRFLLPFLSLLVIGLQVLLDYKFLYSFVSTSISKGVPMGFRSLIVGYADSKNNFLPDFGGPYIAIGVYLFITCILIIIPDSLSFLLCSGLPGSDVNESASPLCIRLRSVERFSSVCIEKSQSYQRLHNVYLAQFYMFINGQYWKHLFLVQKERWRYLYCSNTCIIFFPFYIIFCVFEILLCVVLYGFPIMSFGLTIIRAYCGRLYNLQRRRRFCSKIVFSFITIILIISVLFFLYMFCTIFLDAILFFTRVTFFTFTGVVVYPKVSYGYLIFTLTVIYYIWQSVQEFSLVYQNLLRETISICSSLQRANDKNRLVVKKGDFRGINESLFEYVIENHLPKRKQVFISLLKVTVVLTVLGLLINILVETDGFRELHVVMHVGTALFICAFPQIMTKMCYRHGGKFKQRRMRRELTNIINNYVGYNIQSTNSSTSDA